MSVCDIAIWLYRSKTGIRDNVFSIQRPEAERLRISFGEISYDPQQVSYQEQSEMIISSIHRAH